MLISSVVRVEISLMSSDICVLCVSLVVMLCFMVLVLSGKLVFLSGGRNGCCVICQGLSGNNSGVVSVIIIIMVSSISLMILS